MSAEAWKWAGDLRIEVGGRNGASRKRAAKAVLLVYGHHADRDGLASPARDYVAAYTDLSPRTVSRILDDLRAAGVIELVHRSAPGRSPVYRLRLDVTAASIGEHRPAIDGNPPTPQRLPAIVGNRSTPQHLPAIGGNRSTPQRLPTTHEHLPTTHEHLPAIGGNPQKSQKTQQRSRPEKSNGQRHPTQDELEVIASEWAAAKTNGTNPAALKAKILAEDRPALEAEAVRRRRARAVDECPLCDHRGWVLDELGLPAMPTILCDHRREEIAGEFRCPRCGKLLLTWPDGSRTCRDCDAEGGAGDE